MSREELYLYAVLKQPTDEEKKKGVRAELVHGPGHMVARNEQEVILSVSRALSEDVLKFADRLEVAVRPF